MSVDRPESADSFAALRRIFLSILAIIVLLNLVFSVLATRSQAQIQDKFQLYQTNLVLTASEWQPDVDKEQLDRLKTSLFGENAIASAIEQYQSSETSNRSTIAQIDRQLTANNLDDRARDKLSKTKILATAATAKLDLNLGILTAAKGDIDRAVKIWQRAIDNSSLPQIKDTGKALIKAWQNPSKLDRTDLDTISKSLNGWFRDRTLMQVYRSTDDSFNREQLGLQIQEDSTNAIGKLAFLSIGRILLGFTGLALLIFAAIKSILAIVRRPAGVTKLTALSPQFSLPWTTPWNWEIIAQVLLVGFFLVGQFIVPALFSTVFKINPTSVRIQSLYILSSYIVMAILGVGVTYFSIKSFFPLPNDWFKFSAGKANWFLWGVGGYLVAIPIVTIVSLLNNLVWQGQGGSNPILEIVLEGKDPIAVFVFFLTAAVAAPLFEEFFFRGFLLPSLTKYLPVWGAILVSAAVFGIAHLSLSEILPLTVLGTILGIVYTRTRNLLSSMLLHSLWNAGTLVSLLILGSGNS